MKLKEILKEFYANKNLFIVVCVFLLTISTIGISYSAFFTVKSNTNNQTVTTGTLSVSYTGEDTPTVAGKLTPLPDRDALNLVNNKIVYVKNTENSTLAADYVLTIGYNMDAFNKRTNALETDELTPIEFIKFAIYEYNAAAESEEAKSTLIAGPMTVADLPVYTVDSSDYRNNRYLILFDSLKKVGEPDSTKTYQIKVWLSDKTTPAASNTYFYVNSEIEAVVTGAMVTYDISGVLKNIDGSPLAGATINIQNASRKVTTSDTGAFTIPNLYPGTYNVVIKANDKDYVGNITLKKGSNFTITNYGPTFQGTSSNNIFDFANTLGTTVSKIMQVNEFNDVSNHIVLNETNYNLMSSYLITTNKQKVDNITMTLTDNGLTIS